MAELSWVAASLLTGQIIADLPDIELTEPLAVTIGQPESVQVNLRLTDKTNPSWFAATQEGGAVLVAYVGDPSSPNVLWGGIVNQRVRDTTNVVSLGLSTAEGYLDRCYVRDYSATSVNQDTIVASLMGFATGTNHPPFTLHHLANASTFLQTVSYASSDNVTVLSALQNLSAISGGPEWTIYWTWDLAAGTIKPTFAYGARVGSAVTQASPNVTIELADLLDGSSLTEDYTTGYGANSITTWGAPPTDATDDSVPSASATSANLNGRPLWSYAYQPDSTVSDPAILADYAEQALSAMTDGARPLSLQIPNDVPGKELGVDWFLGDDLGWSMTGVAFPEEPSGVARCIGYQLDYTSITPVLQGATL